MVMLMKSTSLVLLKPPLISKCSVTLVFYFLFYFDFLHFKDEENIIVYRITINSIKNLSLNDEFKPFLALTYYQGGRRLMVTGSFDPGLLQK